MTKIGASLVALLALGLPLLASEHYVAPAGTPSGTGSKERPWDLATALAQPSAVQPGDTIWLRGGTYTGHFTSTLRGAVAKPIVVRQYAGERATLDGNDGSNAVTLLVNGADAWFWGFEITNSSGTRLSSNASQVPGRGEGVNLLGVAQRVLPSKRGAFLAVAGVGAWLAVVAGAVACSFELAISGTVPLGTVLPAMLGVHVLIGVGEAVITVGAVSAVLSTRPDVVRVSA